MIIARAAKGAALLLMIFGVVALIGCPAATGGPRGPAGADGDKGDKGDPGATGQPGPAALQAKGDAGERYAILINNAGTTAAPTVGDLTKPSTSADVTALFVGGVKPITYTISSPPPTTNYFTASIEDNMIVVGKRTGVTAPTLTTDTRGSSVDGEAPYSTGAELAVRATDANGATATKLVAIRHNRAPHVVQGVTASRNFMIVGTQATTYGTGATARKARNVATILDMKDFGINPYFSDDGDTSLADHTLAIKKMTRGSGDDAETKAAEHITAAIGTDGKSITVTGLKSTWDADASPAAHVPVKIELEITDPGGMTAESEINVTVDGAPQVGDTDPQDSASITKKAGSAASAVLNNLATFYSDPEGVTATFAGVTVTPSVRGSAEVDASGNLMLTPLNRGVVTIKYFVVATGMPADASGNFLPGNYIDRDGDGSAEVAAEEFIASQVIEQSIKVTITP